MRPTTKNLLHAPMGDFPYVRRMITLLSERLGLPLGGEYEERICLYLYCSLLERSDRESESFIIRHVENKWSHWNYKDISELRETVESVAEAARQRHSVPMYGSTSDEARAYWKDRTYGLTNAQKQTEDATSYTADGPQATGNQFNAFYNFNLN